MDCLVIYRHVMKYIGVLDDEDVEELINEADQDKDGLITYEG